MTKENWQDLKQRYGVLVTAQYMRDLGFPIYLTVKIHNVI